MPYIYMIENKVNHKKYIGKTEQFDPYKRWAEHIRSSRKEDISNRPLYFAMRKYGIKKFKFTVIEKTNIPEEREQYYIALYDTYNTGYNATLGGDGKKLVNEQEIIDTYLENRNITLTSKILCHCDKTVKRVLQNAGIETISSEDFNKTSFSKAVKQIDKSTGKIINIYQSASDAGRYTYTGKNTKAAIDHIIDVCNAKRKTANGFMWEYVA